MPPVRPEELKNPALAAFLSFCIPGAGHFYQGRMFKGALYSVCILGTFFFGQVLGDWKVVYMDWHPERRTWAYVCQFWSGAVAWPALLQNYTRSEEAFHPRLYQPTTTRFTGEFEGGGQVVGEISLTPDRTVEGFSRVTGELTGTLTGADGNTAPLKGTVRDIEIEPQVAPDSRRFLRGDFEGAEQGITGELRGSIPRSLSDWYGAPLQDDPRAAAIAVPHDSRTPLERAHAELGARFELGVLYTMVAGLLNILCLFDALEGPAYETREEEATDPEGLPVPTVA